MIKSFSQLVQEHGAHPEQKEPGAGRHHEPESQEYLDNINS